MSAERPRDLAALISFIESRQNAPYAWGRDANDCIAFMLGAVEAQTGRKIAEELTWSREGEALRAVSRLGGLEAALDAHFQRIPPSLARRGDIGGVPDEVFGVHPMIVEGELLVGPGDRGNRRLPRRAMTMAWSTTLPAPEPASG